MKCAATYEGVGQDAGWLEHCAADPRGYREEMGLARAARGRAATTARASIVEGDRGERKRKEGGRESRCVVKYVCGSRVGSTRRIARKSTLAISRTCGALLHRTKETVRPPCPAFVAQRLLGACGQRGAGQRRADSCRHWRAGREQSGTPVTVRWD